MKPVELYRALEQGFSPAYQRPARWTDGQVIIPVLGGEIVFHNFSKYGSGAWYFNDTAD